MSTAATLDSADVEVTPGEEVVVPLHIRNNGTVVEDYDFEVLGPARTWIVVQALSEGVMPGATTSTTVTFRPPRDAAVPAGEFAFGIQVLPRHDPSQAVVPEGYVQVLAYLDTTSELIPRASQGSRRGRHQVAVDNRSNIAVPVMLQGASDGEVVDVECRPPAVTVMPGETVFADVVVRARSRIWRNQPVTHPIEVVVTPTDSAPVVLQGTFVQGPVAPPWLWKLLAALLALAVALVLLWFTVLKPTIESQAEEAVEEEAAAAAESAEKAEQAAQSAGGAAGEAKDARDDVRAEQEGKPAPRPPAEVPVAERLTTTGAAPDVYAVPQGNTFQLTDLVLGNPQGDFGRVQVLVGDTVLFDLALENFRDLDYHFVSPIVVGEGGIVQLQADCARPGRPPAAQTRPSACDVSLYLGGQLTAT
jgi:hypothetical protein